MTPDISVVMSVYNGEETIRSAVESILNQTFKNIELIVVDDGSSDKTLEILSTFSDKRLKLIRHKHDYISSLNLGIESAFGKYIARMDADDYMHPERLKYQWTFMEKHLEIDICSTWMQSFGLSKKIISNYSGKVNDMVYLLLKGNPICHPTVMMRNEIIKKKKMKYDKYVLAEDYKLWFEAVKKGLSFYVIPLILHYYRHSKEQQTSKHWYMQVLTSCKIKEEILEYLIQSQNNPHIQRYLTEGLILYKKKIINLQQICNIFLFIKKYAM